jgi:hypothetical protein
MTVNAAGDRKGLVDSTPDRAVLLNPARPRGTVHDTRALTKNLLYPSVFLPHLPAGTDINWL